MKSYLSKTFEFVSFPKIVPKKKKFIRLPVKDRNIAGRKGLGIIFRAKKGRSGVPKEKTRSQLIKILDSMVSDFVLTKICRGKCMRCGKQHEQYENSKGEKKWSNYGTSHFWPRDYMGTRFDIDNLDGLCWLPCHSQRWEKSKQGDYRDYMLKKLGQNKFELLEYRARAITKRSTLDIKLMIANFEKLYALDQNTI